MIVYLLTKPMITIFLSIIFLYYAKTFCSRNPIDTKIIIPAFILGVFLIIIACTGFTWERRILVANISLIISTFVLLVLC